MFNPLDDIAMICDLEVFLNYDPTKESPEDFLARMEAQRAAVEQFRDDNPELFYLE